MRRAPTFRVVSCLSALVLIMALVTGCANDAPAAGPDHGEVELQAIPLTEGEKLQVVATTNIVGDVVRNVGGDAIALTTLMGIGVDPHSYVPTPSDMAAIHDAHVMFANGAGLETDLDRVFAAAGGAAAQVHVSEGIDFLAHPMSGEKDEHEGDAEEAHEYDSGDIDPHVWFSVPNAIHWVGRIEATLSVLDPASAAVYERNAHTYVEELEALDAWIQEQVDRIPGENRKMVTNHPTFGYFADRYGLEQVGAVYPLSPSAEPSARDVAALQDAIREFGVPAVFAESTVNADLVEQVAADTGIRLVPLYSGSLSKPGDGAATYIELMRYDVEAIVDALRSP